jgi:hypothetical protein
MSTQEIADRLVELYNQGKPTQAEEELYADEVISHEQNGSVTTGKEAVIKKTATAFETFDASHKNEATKVYVNQDTFLVIFEMEMLMEGMKTDATEYGYYKTKDGKIAEEYFYFAA